jgi:flagellar hook-associated protein 1 FlgK
MVAIMNIDAMQSALQGLNVAQQLIDVTSQNISNASTAGYTTKTLGVNDLVAGGQVVGVSTGQIQRNVNQSLQSSVWNETSASSNQSTINTALSSIQTMYGTADAGTNFSSYLSTLNDDFTQLAATPNSTTLQQQTVVDAQTFANSINSTAQAITSARTTAEAGITSSVNTINSELTNIAQLNTQVASALNSGTGAADLEDQRDQAIATLSQQIGISTYPGQNGVVVVQTASGQPLADTQAHQLVFTTQPVGAQSVYPNNLGGVYIDSATTGYDLASQNTQVGGTLGAQLELRDTILPQQQAQLDELSEQTANRFAAQGMKLFTDSSGNIPGPAPTAYAGFSSEFTVNPTVVSTPADVQQGTSGTAIAAGDSTVIQNVLNYAFGLNSDSSGTPNVPFNTTGLGAAGNISIGANFPTATTIQNFAQEIMTTQASQASDASSNASFSSSYLATLQTSFSNSSAVNLDSQVANLTVYENAYSCSAQVVSTEQKLMAALLSSIGGTGG